MHIDKRQLTTQQIIANRLEVNVPMVPGPSLNIWIVTKECGPAIARRRFDPLVVRSQEERPMTS